MNHPFHTKNNNAGNSGGNILSINGDVTPAQIIQGDPTSGISASTVAGTTTIKALKFNLTAIVNPTVTDDSSLGYSIGSVWFNKSYGQGGGSFWVAQSVGVGAANWQPMRNSVMFNAAPTVNDDNTLGYFANFLWLDLNTMILYWCFNAVTGAATWLPLVTGVSSVNSSDTSLTVTPTSGAVDAIVNLAHSFNWSALHTFNTVLPTSSIFPTLPDQLITKLYADSFQQGLFPYLDCQLATTANIVLVGEQVIDGILTSASRVLVKNQVLQKDNGIYITGAGAWTRATDFNVTAEILTGAFFYISQGTANAGFRYAQYLFDPTADTLGIDPIAFTIISQTPLFTANNGVQLVGSNFSANVDNTTIETNANQLRIKDLGVTTAKINTLAVTTAKIANNAVTYGKIQAASVGGKLLGSPSVGTAIQEISLGAGLQMTAGVLHTSVTFLTGSGSLNFPNTAARSSSDLTIAVPGAVLNQVVCLGVPNSAVVIDSCYTAWVSAANVVTVRFNNYTNGAINPVPGQFNVRLFV